MAKNKEIIENKEQMDICTLMSNAFGEYSKSIIQERAIPDARDGLKPVQRRIVYAMTKDGNTFDKPYRKAVKGVSATMSNFHAHGDSSIYGAMVFLAQDWKNNLPLVDAWGNVGSIDGDGPCAMRYLETRLHKNTTLLTEDLDYKTVEMVPNFDDTTLEPTVLPSKIPLLLINGSTGIAAGYATDIPPFNFNEIVNACIYKLTHKKMTIDDLMKIVKGPDFPTGGYIIGSPKHAMATGKGKIVNSCAYSIEEGKKSNLMIITEIPFDTSKQDIVKEVNALDKDFIIEVRDESDKNGIRIVVEFDKNIDAQTAVNYILKNTNFQKNYNFNMVAIVGKTPKQVGVLELIECWCDFRKEVIVKKYNYLLNQYQNRKEIVEGFIKAVSLMDKIVKVIKSSKDKPDVIKNLIGKFEFSENQANAIAEMKLYRLCNTDVVALETELDDLNKKITNAEKIVSSDKEIVKTIIKELENINKTFIFERKTKILEEKVLEIDEKKLIQNEDFYIVVTKDGYIKKLPLKRQNEDQFIKNDDEIVYKGEINSHNYLKAYTNLGGYLSIQIHKIPECKSTELGTHISKWVRCDGHKILFVGNDNLIAWTKNGMIKIFNTPDSDINKMINIPIYFKLKEGDEIMSCEKLEKTHILTLTKTNANLYPVEEITETSLSSIGLTACKIKENDELLKISQINIGDKIKLNKKTIDTSKLCLTHRGYIGQKY